MAALAGGNVLVLVFVAGYTTDTLVLGLSLCHQINGFLVAAYAHHIGRIGFVGDDRRHVGLVAAFAVTGHHIRAVRFVALGTGGNPAVDVMAEAAGQLGMLAWVLLQLTDLCGMAAGTLSGDIICQFDGFWGMGVAVAAFAVGQLVMRLATVTGAALRNNVFGFGWMPNVAVLTGYRCFVFCPVCSNVCRCLLMAFHAVGVAKRRVLRRRFCPECRCGQCRGREH